MVPGVGTIKQQITLPNRIRLLHFPVCGMVGRQTMLTAVAETGSLLGELAAPPVCRTATHAMCHAIAVPMDGEKEARIRVPAHQCLEERACAKQAETTEAHVAHEQHTAWLTRTLPSLHGWYAVELSIHLQQSHGRHLQARTGRAHGAEGWTLKKTHGSEH
jgi:hypothetical protein